MRRRKKEGRLTEKEKRIVKALLVRGWRNQDIQHTINIGRASTINSARITEVKNDNEIQEANSDEVEYYLNKKKHYDTETGLNLYDDELIIRSREAMQLAVGLFNNPSIKFKTEVFSVLAIISWTYLFLDHYSRKNLNIKKNDGKMKSFKELIEMDRNRSKNERILSRASRENLLSLMEIRNEVEHNMLRRADINFMSLFQACCLNYDAALSKLYGEDVSLKKALSLSIQFSKPNILQIAELSKYDIPEYIEALDRRLEEKLNDDILNSIEYKFKVVFMLDSATKSEAHIKFISPHTDQAKEIKNILVRERILDDKYPYKPKEIAAIVSNKTNKTFKVHNHTNAWKKFKVRPEYGSKQPDATDKRYCIYHKAHKDYTYSEEWVNLICEKIDEIIKIK